jgi:cytochrome b subunit of formate dehydrogenase
LGDWIRKLVRIRLGGNVQGPAWDQPPDRRSAVTGTLRMYGFERLEHAILVVSFTVLAWTGFALKYPQGWWARPLVAWENRWPVRGTVHRVAAVVFMSLVVMHVVSLIKSKRLREHWKHLWLRAVDMREAITNFAFNIGLRSRQPDKSTHSYVEKIEYWAVVWGAAVMILSGVLLWAHDWTLAWLPKSTIDFATAVHWYEAVLATLAVLVWHLYSVIFDPDVYPMESAWLTGRSVRQRGHGTADASITTQEPVPDATTLSPKEQEK